MISTYTILEFYYNLSGLKMVLGIIGFMRPIVLLAFLLLFPPLSNGWGFFAHKKINRLAIFTLPPEMIGFYKANIQYLTEKSVNPDMRRYAVKNEAPRHYLDVDVYGDSAVYKMPRYWSQAVARYSEDTLRAYGVVPYHVELVSSRLIKAFAKKDPEAILRISADLGHYISDANVPLHTTENYNGQLTGQYGIHGFWESRLPELFADGYDLFVGQARYIENTQLHIWDAVTRAHEALDSVLVFEQELTRKFPESKKYSFEERGNSTVRTYSFEFSEAYHQRLNGMVERRMKAAVKMVGDYWFTCWVKAGQPNLEDLYTNTYNLEDTVYTPDLEVRLRNHESFIKSSND